MPPHRTTSDLGSGDNTLSPFSWNDEQRAAAEALARKAISRQPDSEILLQMLGLEPYEAATRPRNKTPIKHGVRSGYTNRGCGKEGSPPCPASPTCAEANTAYYRTYRAGAAA